MNDIFVNIKQRFLITVGCWPWLTIIAIKFSWRQWWTLKMRFCTVLIIQWFSYNVTKYNIYFFDWTNNGALARLFAILFLDTIFCIALLVTNYTFLPFSTYLLNTKWNKNNILWNILSRNRLFYIEYISLLFFLGTIIMFCDIHYMII